MRFSICLVLFVLVLYGCGDAPTTNPPPTIDGYTYKTVKIGEQEWFAENLRTTVYSNGTEIPARLTGVEWGATRAGATAVYGEGNSSCQTGSPDIDPCDDAQSLAAYGRLYNWYAVDDARGLCPVGWHVPTHGEWTKLEQYVTSHGFAGLEGTSLRSVTGWSKNDDGTDDFGFSALPGGWRDNVGGSFDDVGDAGGWWSSSPNGASAWMRILISNYSPIGGKGHQDPRDGLSVRCIRD